MKLQVKTTVDAPIADVWHAYTTPQDIMQWNTPTDDWHTTVSEVDLRVGGTFTSRIEARDKSAGIDFTGTYTRIDTHQLIEYSLGARGASVSFEETPAGVVINVQFDADTLHSEQDQQATWQAILNNFKDHVEKASKSGGDD